MKKSSLTTSVVAGIAGVAGLVNVSTALNVNPDGLGQVLIYPYYTTNGGNTTAISIVNTTDDVKAVKVRFLEGRNSQEVLDFNLYLSPFDVWTGAVVDQGNADGPAFLITADNSCTAPAIPPGGEPFKNFEYASNNPDGGPYHIQRTREGHVEMIEMGRVVDDGDILENDGVSVSAVDRNPGNPAPFAGSDLATAATHLTTGVPDDCDAILAAWGPGGQWTTNRNLDIDTPNGGLFGGAQIIDTSNGTNLSYNADAIEGFYISETFQNLHFSPGTVDPKLNDAQSSDSGEATAVIFNNGTLYQFTFTQPGRAGRNAVSAVFMHNEIYNEYNTNAFTASESEWVVTFPTKRLHTEELLLEDRLPFRSTYVGDNTAPFDNLIGACEPIDVAFYDREEQVPGNIPPDLIFSPPPPNQEAPGLNLCFEAQVITFNQPTAGEVLIDNDPSAILGSYYPRNINLCQIYNADGSCQDDGVFTLGWMRMTLGDPGLNFMFTEAVSVDPTNPNIIVGLPATGFWAANYINADAEPGLLANYSGLHKHRADRDTLAGEVFEDLTYTIFEGSGL